MWLSSKYFFLLLSSWLLRCCLIRRWNIIIAICKYRAIGWVKSEINTYISNSMAVLHLFARVRKFSHWFDRTWQISKLANFVLISHVKIFTIYIQYCCFSIFAGKKLIFGCFASFKRFNKLIHLQKNCVTSVKSPPKVKKRAKKY